jgi:hypothetical protein
LIIVAHESTSTGTAFRAKNAQLASRTGTL